MDARLLTRCTNVALVAIVGMGAGHLLMPARPTASGLARAACVVAVATAGAIAAARERSIAPGYSGRPAGPITPWLVTGALASLALAALAWYLVHG